MRDKKPTPIQGIEYRIASWFRKNGLVHDNPPGQGKGYDQYGNILKCFCGEYAIWFPMNRCDIHYTGQR